MKFNLTEEAQKIILGQLSKQGLLAIEIQSSKETELTIALTHENTQVMTMGPVKMFKKGVLEIEGLKAVLEPMTTN